MLNIGKLSGGAAEYYIGEVASAAEDYYTGHGEAAGRWVGSIAAELGLAGEVDPEHFRRVLNGRHPFTEEFLVSSQGSAARARSRANPDTVALKTRWATAARASSSPKERNTARIGSARRAPRRDTSGSPWSRSTASDAARPG